MPMKDMQESGVVGRTDIFKIDPRQIAVKPGWNPRLDFDLSELIESIRANGVRNPLIVRRNREKVFELVDGERRLRATLALLGEGCEIKSVPCKVESVSTTEPELLISAIVANQGKPFLPTEEAEAFRRFVAWGWEPSQIAYRIGKSESFVRGRLTLLGAEPELRQALEDRTIPVTKAVEVIRESRKTGASQAEVREKRRAPEPVDDTDKRKVQAHRKLMSAVDFFGVSFALKALALYCEEHGDRELAKGLHELLGGQS